MRKLRRSLTYLAILILIEWILIKYVQYLIRKRPPNNPIAYIQKTPPTAGKKAIVCVGDSITEGTVSYNYVQLLQKRVGTRFDLINAGVNSELAYEVWKRLDEVIICQPDIITILVGTNDANSSRNKLISLRTMKHRKLPHPPSREWFEQVLTNIVAKLQRETRAQIALLSLPPIGETLDSEEFALSRAFSDTIRRVAQKSQVTYLPLFERIADYLIAHQDQITPKDQEWRIQMLETVIEEKILGRDFDEVSQRHGFLLHADMLHMNSKGAAIIADLIEEFARSR